MRVLNIRNAVVGWMTMEVGKRVIRHKVERMTPWRTRKSGGRGRAGAAVAGFAVVAGGAWLARRLTGGDDSAE